jgi:hypothetical protein
VNRWTRKPHIGKRRRSWYPGLMLELGPLRCTDPDMSPLTEVEYITNDPPNALLSTSYVALRIGISEPVAWSRRSPLF